MAYSSENRGSARRRGGPDLARWCSAAGRQPGGVAEIRILHAQTLRLAVHHLREIVLAAGDRLGQRNAGVIPRLDDHALDQVFHRYLGVDLDEHARALRPPGLLRDRHGLVDLDRALLDCGEGERDTRSSASSAMPAPDARRQPGRRGSWTGGRFDQQPGLGGQRGRGRHLLGERQQREKQEGQEQRTQHGHGGENWEDW